MFAFARKPRAGFALQRSSNTLRILSACTASLVLAATASEAQTPASIPDSVKVVDSHVAKQGYFYVGGHYVGAPGKEVMIGQMYVEVSFFRRNLPKLQALKLTFTFTFTFFSSLYNSTENMFLLELHIFTEISQNLNLWARTLNGVCEILFAPKSPKK